MFSRGGGVPVARASHITKSCKIERVSDISNILAFLNSLSETPLQPGDVIKNCAKQLSEALETENDEAKSKKLLFVIEQLTLSQQTTKQRRYSTSFLWSALTWQKTSPALYSLMADDGLITLPSSSYLKRL